MADKNELAERKKMMKKKYLEYGAEIFEPHELLEFVLYYAAPRKDANLLAHQLLERFGSISGLLDAPMDLIVEAGVSENSAFLFKFLSDLYSVYKNDKLKSKNGIVNIERVPEQLINLYLNKRVEMVFLILTDKNLKELYSGMVSSGTVVNTDLNIPRICELAVHYAARYAIISHNHPDGNIQPSRADMIATTNLYQTLAHLNVVLIDHFVVSGMDCTSLYDSGMFFKTIEEFQNSKYGKNYYDFESDYSL